MASKDIKYVSVKTDIEVSKVRYTWTINNVKFRFKDFEPLCSGIFKTSNEVSWQTKVQKVSHEYLEFELECLGPPDKTYLDCPTEFYYALLRSSKGEMRLSKTAFDVLDHEYRPHVTVPCPIKYNEILKFAAQTDTLTFVCYVVTKVNERLEENGSETKAVPNVAMPPCHLLQDYEALLRDHRLSDVTLVVEGQDIKAHKAILAVRSPVFSAMFNSNMVENRKNQVQITDVELEVALQMLRFIYTGKAEVKPEMADRLLAAADKYALDQLKTECEQILRDMISVANAVQMLILADRHNALLLRTHALQFIKINADNVEGDDLKAMVEKHPELMIELFLAKVTA